MQLQQDGPAQALVSIASLLMVACKTWNLQGTAEHGMGWNEMKALVSRPTLPKMF